MFSEKIHSVVYTLILVVFVALEHKFGLVCTLLHRSFTIVSDFFPNFVLKLKHSRKHFTKMLIQQTLLTNVYLNLLTAYLFKNLLLPSVPKLELRIILPFLGNISSITKKRLNRCIGKRLKFCNLKIIFQTGNRLMNYFRFKDCIPETLQSNFVYKFKCGSCTASYYGKTYRHMKVRISEHPGVCLLEQVNESKVRYPRQLETTC